MACSAVSVVLFDLAHEMSRGEVAVWWQMAGWWEADRLERAGGEVRTTMASLHGDFDSHDLCVLAIK